MSTLTFNPENHEYCVDGIVKPSVTHILSNVGTRREGSDGKKHWSPIGFDDRFFDESGNASKFGEHFHFVARCKVSEVDVEYDPRMRPWVRGLEKFLHDYRKTFSGITRQLVEVPMYSKKYGYAGTPDWYFETVRENFNIDWKTGIFQKSSRIQTAGYGNLEMELFGYKKMPRRMVIQILPDDYKVDDRKRNPEDWNNFLSLLNTWKMAA